MRTRVHFLLLIVVVTAAFPGDATGSASGERLTLVHAGTLLAVPGRAPTQHQTLVIQDGRIRAIRDGYADAGDFPAAMVDVVDWSDRFVLPGMIDLHVHLSTEVESGEALRVVTQDSAELALIARRHAFETLAAGFTTVVDLGTGRRAHEDAIRALRDSIRTGSSVGPRILMAGSPIASTGSSRTGRYLDGVEATVGPQAVCDRADECRRAVREQIGRGADVITFYNTGSLNDVDLADRTFTDEEMRAIIEAAHAWGRPVIADGHKAEGINAALRAGADIIDTAPWPDEATWALMKSRAAFFEPHLHAFQVAGASETGRAPANSRVRDVLAHASSAQQAFQKGVRIAYGSDTGIVTHGDNGGDLEELVRIGLSPMQAIEVATVNSAAAIGLSHQIGTLEPGKDADLVAVHGDPLTNIKVLRQIANVMRAGKMIASPENTDTPRVLIVWAGRVYSPGAPPLSKQSIIVRGGVIERIVPGYLPASSINGQPEEVQLLDLSKQFVVPGMIDLHVHLSTGPSSSGALEDVTLNDADLALRIASNAEVTLHAGITTVLDMGTGRRAHERAIYAVRDAIRAGKLTGPQILAVGSPISTPGNSRIQHFRVEVDEVVGPQGVCTGADDCRRAVREQVRRGADAINFYNTGSLLAPGAPAQTFTNEEMRAIVQTAHSLHRKAIADGAGTAKSAEGINAALRAGADWIDTGIYPDAMTWDLLAQHQKTYVPHLYALVAAVGDTPQTLDQGSMGWLPEPALKALFDLKQQPPAAATAVSRGISMALASDAGVFAHGANAHELIEYVRLGMSARQAIDAATINPARALGLDGDRGSLVTGARADFIAVEGDPLTDIHRMLKVNIVVYGGKIIRQ